MDPNIILSISTTIAGASVLLLYRSIYNRICTLELNAQNKGDADQAKKDILDDLEIHAKRDDDQFQAVQHALKDFRTDMQREFVAIRTESNEKRTEMRNDVMNLRGENNSSFARMYDLLDRQRPTPRRAR